MGHHKVFSVVRGIMQCFGGTVACHDLGAESDEVAICMAIACAKSCEGVGEPRAIEMFTALQLGYIRQLWTL